MYKILLILSFLFCGATMAQTGAPFNYKKIILGTTATTLSSSIQQKDKTTGQVSITGVDTQGPAAPFTFVWGDNTITSGFFPSSHTYSDASRNYIAKVIATYPGNAKDTVTLVIDFIVPSITPQALDPKTKVFIPSTAFSFAGTRLYSPPALASFPDNIFTSYPRSTVEYILSVASSIGYDLVNADTYLYNGKFEQYMLRDASYGGAYSIWYTNPVGFGVGDVFVNGDVDFSSLTHEMGHNYTLSTPANFYYGGKIDGNGNAIYSEAMAQMFAHAAGYEMINNSAVYGINEDMRIKLIEKFNASAKYVRARYSQYVTNGKHFFSWNDPSTGTDETFDTFMTIAFKFMEHTENAGIGYKVPFKRMMTCLQKFNATYQTMYAQATNSTQADIFRSTLMVAAISSAFNTDLRSEFMTLNFPIDNTIFNQLYVITPMTSQTITFGPIASKTIGNAPFTLGASASSGLSIQYTSSANAKLTISGNQATIVGPGSVTVNADQPGDGSYAAASRVSQTFCINPVKPTITLSATNTEAPLLTSNSSSGNQWFLNGTAIGGATNVTFTVAGPGAYTLQTKVDNCASVMSDQQVLIVTSDLASGIKQEFTISPNPATDYVNIGGLKGEMREAHVVDLSGRTIPIVLEKKDDIHRFNVQGLPEGLYLLRIQDTNTINQVKFVKK